MSDIIKNNYKKILLIVPILFLIFVCPTIVEIIFKFGNIVGTFIRTYGSGGFCI